MYILIKEEMNVKTSIQSIWGASYNSGLFRQNISSAAWSLSALSQSSCKSGGRGGQNSPRTHRNQGLTTSHWRSLSIHRIVVTQIHRDDLLVLYQQLKRDAV
jgi:hypothetical protein